MNDALINSVPIECRLTNLRSFTADPLSMETIVRQDESFGVSVTVEFGRSGAIALMPLAVPIQVEFFAKPFGKGDTIAMGTATVTTQSGQLTYHLTLTLPKGPDVVGFIPETVYNIRALLRIGAPAHPALITGYIENLAIQTYTA